MANLPYSYLSDVGKTIWSRDKASRGKVSCISQRYCAACQCIHKCYIVQWDDGSTTKPCCKGVGYTSDKELIIL